jgi:phospholipid/cholesterol/gamma-HCH transport system ATP-binding protein
MPVENGSIELAGIVKSYDGISRVVDGVNLKIGDGSYCCFLGPSGCGKTTILRMIAGVLKPRSGTVKVAGRAINELDQRGLFEMRRRMGMLYQFGALFTDLSAFDNVAFQMREHTNLPEAMIEDLALMKLNAVGLRGARDMMPSELSGGMARRVALARAIALDPALIMYDEPFTGLDPISMGVISNLIRQLNTVLGTTSIIVTHDVQESLKIVDYVYFMSDGVVVAEGTPEDIRNSKAPFVHQFVWGEIDGPMPFHYQGAAYEQDLELEAARA